MTAVEAIALWTWPLRRLRKLLRDVDGEHLLRDRPAERGVLILVPHFGNWEFLGYYPGTLGPLAPLYERPKSAVADAVLRAARERLGHEPAADSAGGLRHLLRWLSGGGVVAVLPDQVPTLGAGVAAPFFGHEAFTMTLVGKLLKRLDVDVLLGMAMRVEGGFDVRLERMDPAIRNADPRRSATAMNAAVEAVVERAPAQYQWEYKRFRFPRQPNIYV
jgi:KDO2-lipid IV(A) lauroyltransferase